MTFWEIVKTCVGYYRGWEEANGFVPSDQILAVPDIKETEVSIQAVQIEQKKIFEHIYGHNSLKTIFTNVLSNDQPVHILLTGSPGTAKSLFLEAISDNVKQSYFINNNSTGAGILSYLYDHPELQFLLIDEIEKIGKLELSVLLTLMETGRIIVQKKTMSVNRRQKLTIFATCNRIDKISPEMLSRFLKFHLKEYSQEEFNTIATHIVTERFNRTQEFAQKIALAVWYKIGSKDIRDVIKLARLAKKNEDINMIIEAVQEYSENKN